MNAKHADAQRWMPLVDQQGGPSLTALHNAQYAIECWQVQSWFPGVLCMIPCVCVRHAHERCTGLVATDMSL